MRGRENRLERTHGFFRCARYTRVVDYGSIMLKFTGLLFRRTAVLLLLLFPAEGVLLEFLAHGDVLCGDGNARLVRHTCGAVERHVPLSDHQYCFVCAWTSSQLTTEAQTQSVAGIYAAVIVPAEHPARLASSFSSHPTSRGPPDSSV